MGWPFAFSTKVAEDSPLWSQWEEMGALNPVETRCLKEAEDGLIWQQWEGRPLVLMKTQCPIVMECQGSKVGECWWMVEHPHRGRGGEWDSLCVGKMGKGISFEM